MTEAQAERVEQAVDVQLVELRRLLLEVDGPLPADEVGPFLRAAYGRGYCDAIQKHGAGEQPVHAKQTGRKLADTMLARTATARRRDRERRRRT